MELFALEDLAYHHHYDAILVLFEDVFVSADFQPGWSLIMPGFLTFGAFIYWNLCFVVCVLLLSFKCLFFLKKEC